MAILLIALLLAYVGAIFVVQGPETALRIVTNLVPNTSTYKIFPQRAITNDGTPSLLESATLADFPKTITFPVISPPDNGQQRTVRLSDLMAQTDTKAFIVVRNDKVIYESYLNGATRGSVVTSFSVAKSITSTLIGIAVDEGKIRSVDDAVIKYLPELKGRGLDSLTIRDMLVMSSGVPYQTPDEVFVLAVPFSIDTRQYYTTDLRGLALSVRAGSDPIGAYFNYNDLYSILEALIIERVTGEHVAQYLQDKVWMPMGMEYPASWSLDSSTDGLEKANSDLNARAIDFARLGLMFLHEGNWNGHQIVSQSWVAEATVPDPSDLRQWKGYSEWRQAGGYYKFHWWGLINRDGTFDYMALGRGGQVIYVSPSANTVAVRFGEGDAFQWALAIRSVIHALPPT